MFKKYLNRRTFILSGVLVLLAAAFPFFSRLLTPTKRRKPSSESDTLNVLFITADDLGWRDLSCYGNTNVQTPNLDQLANQGIRFDRAFGVSSSCSSSRASFITGQYISTHGVDGLTHRHLRKQLPSSRPTMPKYFRNAGYHTAIQGKWHVAPLWPTTSYGYKDSLGFSMPWNRHIKNTKEISKYFRDRSEDGRPFYLELNFTDTHRSASGNFETVAEFSVDADTISVPEWMGLPNWPEIRADLARYYSNLLKMDHLFGQTLKDLKKSGLDQNTAVVFVSDNGSPFPGNKMTLLDRGIGTPLMIRLPGKIAAERVSNAFISTIDIMPTLLDLCRIPKGKEIEGNSFANLLLDMQVSDHRQYICAEMNYHVKAIPMRAIRNDRWKAIKNLSDSPIGLDDLDKEPWALKLCEQPDQPWLQARPEFELYDLENDPNEKRNLAGSLDVAEIEGKFRRRLNEDWERVKS